VIGVLKLIKKMWVKFDGMDVECICDEHHRKCRDEGCKEYVVKFTEIERKLDGDLEELRGKIKGLSKEVRRTTSELKRSINKFKI